MQIRHYNEIKPRGTTDFPLEFYHITETHPRYIMDLHWHVELELLYLQSGSLHLTLDGVEYHAKAGDAFWLGGGMLHTAEPTDCVYDCIVFDSALLLRTTSDGLSFLPHPMLPQIFPHPMLQMEDAPTAFAIHTLFSTSSTSCAGAPLLIQGTLLTLMGRIVENNAYSVAPKQPTAASRNATLIKEVLRHIQEHYTEPLALQELARLAGMSPKYFCRFFREMTGRTPIDFVNYYRVEQARDLLISSNQSITNIAYACGFNDSSYFIRTFRRYTGLSPSGYIHAPHAKGHAPF